MGTGGATTRLAPSPTGALHLGNARTFLVNWAMARQRGERILMRIEDLDGPRIKPESVLGIQRTLSWLGIDWDEGPYVQSADLEPYVAAMRALAAKGCAYATDLSRAEIEAAASAPQQSDLPGGAGAESRFPPSLRPAGFDRPREFVDTATNWRFVVREGAVTFIDEFAGPQSRSPAESVGDFVVWTKRAAPSYQLAVVVDDARQGITHVVRGDDLLDSAGRQLLLYRALGLPNEPVYCHLPLVIGADGRRLAKRHGDTRVDTYRDAGVPVERVIGLISHWCGIGPRAAMSCREFVQSIDLKRIPAAPAVFTPEDDEWLRGST